MDALSALQMIGMTGDVLGNQDGSGMAAQPLKLQSTTNPRSGQVTSRAGDTGAFIVSGGGQGGSWVSWAVAGVAIGLVFAWSRKRKR